ncbi:MAG: DUF4394 domain-containing protein [Saprospiraceae bacterium]
MQAKRYTNQFFGLLITMRFCLVLVVFFLFQQAQIQAQRIYALSGSQLISFESALPSEIVSSAEISGLVPDFELAGMDFRPATGQLYGLGYKSSTGEAMVYTIDLNTAALTQVGSISTLMPDMGEIGFDFNPTVDRIRLTGSNGSNFRLHPVTGALAATDGNLAFSLSDVNAGTTASISSVAYTNSYIGASSTTLFDYDYMLNILCSQVPPNNGTLNTIGNSGIVQNTDASADLDIFYDPSAGGNIAYLSANVNSSDTLYSINLTNGSVQAIAEIGLGMEISDIAVFIDKQSPGAITGKLVYALTSNGNLLTFDSDEPQFIRSSIAVSGITMGQTLSGMDSRPATGQLYAFGYNNASGEAQIYTLNPGTGMLTSIAPAVPLQMGMGRISFDFNPTVDRIRVTGSNGSNYRMHPVTGAVVATDGNLAFAAGDVNEGMTPSIGAAAYTNSYLAATSTTLYNYDEVLNILTSQIPPNNGTLNTIGGTGINQSIQDLSTDLDIAFDSASQTNIAFLVANDLSFDNFYLINLQTGAATQLGSIGFGIAITDIAVRIQLPALNAITGQLIYALASNNNLITFDSDAPEIIRSAKAITGIEAGQILSGMDFRPATGQLFGIGYNNATGEAQLYTIDTTNAVITKIGTAATLAMGMGNIGFDFNPTVDRIRVIGANGSNYRLNPNTGAIAATDGNLAYALGDQNEGTKTTISTAAYTNSYIGASSTTLFNYDDSLNIITRQIPPNSGTINTFGPSGITQNLADATSDLDIHYDVATGTNIAYLVSNTVNQDFLYHINLQTGGAELIGKIGNGTAIRDIAIFLERQALNPITGQLVYAISSNNNLLTFDSDVPQVIRTVIPITGLGAGYIISGLDIRPATGGLYALGYNNTNGEAQLYLLDAQTGVLTAIGATSIALAPEMGRIGMDFNPVVDRIRVVSITGQNYRLHPVTGAIAFTDLSLKYAAGDVHANDVPRIACAAYAKNYNTTSGTTLYDYDLDLNILATQNPPNDGVLNTIGSTGLIANNNDPTIDLDIYTAFPGADDKGFLVVNTVNSNFDHFYRIDLVTATSTDIGSVGNGIAILNIAVKPDSIYTLAIKESAEDSQQWIEASPNPVLDQIRFNISGMPAGKLNMEIFTIQGISVISQTLQNVSNQQNLSVDVSQLTGGMYYAIFSIDGKYYGRSKFVKQD